MERIHRVTGVSVYFIDTEARVPLKFGRATASQSTCARVKIRVADGKGREAEGWGESPLSVHWSWPGTLPYEERNTAMKDFCARLASAWMKISAAAHPLEAGCHFNEEVLPVVLSEFNAGRKEGMPRLGSLNCNAPFDVALHDAFGKLIGKPIYDTYGKEFFSNDLSAFLEPAPGSGVSFKGRYPADFLVAHPPRKIRAWHLVGGVDLLEESEKTGNEPNDGYPVVLTEWIKRDGLKCLKVKLRGNDAAWDYQRMVKVGQLGIAGGVEWLTADYNCTVEHPAYVNDMLDKLKDEQPRIYGMILYVEQPFPYDLESHRIDVHSVASRKPLFMDESAHDWRLIRLGRELGWTGVALKTCKTQTEAILSGCWAKAHGMTLMVQDLTNPMLAQIPHVMLAAHVGTIMGVESNGMQFYPAASDPEAAVHPGFYRRQNGCLDWSTASGPGFGFRIEEIKRTLPKAAVVLTG